MVPRFISLAAAVRYCRIVGPTDIARRLRNHGYGSSNYSKERGAQVSESVSVGELPIDRSHKIVASKVE